MRTYTVFTLTGPDRVGIVEEVTGTFLELDGNVETSRMARLGGEFAMLVLVALPEERVAEAERAFDSWATRGYKVTFGRTEAAGLTGAAERYRVCVTGADHEGIVHDIARGLSRSGINIESMETGTEAASVSGITLFTMNALVAVPEGLADEEWMVALNRAGEDANVDVTIEAADA